MGFSLVGNSGDQKTTTNVYDQNYTASLNPQLSQSGSGPGSTGVIVSPNLQGYNSVGEISTTVGNYFAPVNITSTGDNLGDTALKAIQAISSQAGNNLPPQPGTAPPTNTLGSLLSGNTLYFVLGGIVLLFLAHHK